MEFMYAGQVNVAQANLAAFLRTAESLKIRGLTDTSENILKQKTDRICLNPQSKLCNEQMEKSQISSTNNVTSSQDVPDLPNILSPPPKRSKTESFNKTSEEKNEKLNSDNSDNTVEAEVEGKLWQPKHELPDYLSDIDEEDKEDNDVFQIFPVSTEACKLSGIGLLILVQCIYLQVHNIDVCH